MPGENKECAVLRELRETDTESILKWWNDEKVTKYFFGFIMPATLVRVSGWVKKEMEKANNPFFVIDVLDEPGKEIGYAALRDFEPKDRHANLKFMIGDKIKWNKGYGFSAAKQVVDFGFKEMGLRRIGAGCFEPNIASMSLLKKLGFTKEGVRREQTLINGTWTDFVMWGLLKKEYKF